MKVALTGSSPSNKSSLGVYTANGENDGRPMYENGATKLYYVAAAGHWFVGASVGVPSGYFAVNEDAATPDAVTETWQTVVNGAWAEARGVKCLAGVAHEAIVSAARKGAAGAVVLKGATPGGRNSSLLGTYARAAAELHDDRHVYRREADGMALWWAHGSWCVGGPPRAGRGLHADCHRHCMQVGGRPRAGRAAARLLQVRRRRLRAGEGRGDVGGDCT